MIRWMILVSSLLTSFAAAQTFYEPLEYEFRSGDTLYFYGGDQPGVHRAAAELHSIGAAWGRQGGYAFSSASVSTHREVETERIRIFSDSFRYGLQDASVVGLTVADARNEAFASVPRYFQKRQLLDAALQIDGMRSVPVRSGGLTIRKSSGAVLAIPFPPQVILPGPSARPVRIPVVRTSID